MTAAEKCATYIESSRMIVWVTTYTAASQTVENSGIYDSDERITHIIKCTTKTTKTKTQNDIMARN